MKALKLKSRPHLINTFALHWECPNCEEKNLLELTHRGEDIVYLKEFLCRCEGCGGRINFNIDIDIRMKETKLLIKENNIII